MAYPAEVARPREFDEGAVLDVALDQFWTTGYAGTSMDAIATATGLGKGSLYGAFGGKRQLYLRIFEAYCARIADAVAEGLAGPDDGAYARLCAHIRVAAAGIAADTAHRGCLLAKGAAELSEHDPDVTARSRRTLGHLVTILGDDIRAAPRSGTATSTGRPTPTGSPPSSWPSCEASRPSARPGWRPTGWKASPRPRSVSCPGLEASPRRGCDVRPRGH
nr:hypothetical protein GCM10025730_21670 [Promicromonospora thailandica]